MAKYKIQVKVSNDLRRKLKILAEMSGKTFQDYIEGILEDMVSDIEIILSTKTEDK